MGAPVNSKVTVDIIYMTGLPTESLCDFPHRHVLVSEAPGIGDREFRLYSGFKLR